MERAAAASRAVWLLLRSGMMMGFLSSEDDRRVGNKSYR